MDSSTVVSSTEVTQKQGAPLARSSHAVAVVGDNAFVFGGESEPRVPIDNRMHVFNLTSRTWSVTEAKGDVPEPRVGVAMASSGTTIFIFGGRDQTHQELNEFYSFDTVSNVWKLLSSGDSSPPHRSYHTIAADKDGGGVYVFGGCGKEGRLNDLWLYNVESESWKELPKSTCSPRGGPGLAVTDGAVWVLFGFDGEELSDIHKFVPSTREWHRVEVPGDKPAGRSVFGTSTVGNSILIFGGEVDPSNLGHLGAGAFTDELLMLDTENLIWKTPKLHVAEGGHPGPRGWFAAAEFKNSMLVYGGNSPTNDRLDDMFLLTIA